MERTGMFALKAMRHFIVMALSAMVVLVFANVVLRYGFNSGISISEELSRTLFVWLTFTGAVVAMYDHGHLGVDTLVRRLPYRGQVGCAVACDLLMLVCSALLMVGSWQQVLINWNNAAPVSGMPIGITHLAAFVSSIGLIAVVASHLWRVLAGRARADDLVQVVESEDRVPELPNAELPRENAR
jgi:TRAP-type C4-dicarboxylate transport system permease small subunit